MPQFSRNSHFQILIFHKIYFSNSNFSQNSHFQILIFHKNHIFRTPCSQNSHFSSVKFKGIVSCKSKPFRREVYKFAILSVIQWQLHSFFHVDSTTFFLFDTQTTVLYYKQLESRLFISCLHKIRS